MSAAAYKRATMHRRPTMPPASETLSHTDSRRIARGLRPWLLGFSIASAAIAARPPEPRPEIAALFRPFETEHVTLSPDGRHVAYTQRQGEKLILVLRDLEANTAKRVLVGEDRAGELSGAREKTPARLNFLRWAAGGRLVFNLNAQNVWSIRADGTDERRMADPRDFEPPPRVILGAAGAAHLPPPPPPPVSFTLNERDQSIRVVALPRGDDHVYVEALALNQMSVFDRDRSVIPRVVVRINVDTGKTELWGECQPRATGVLTDQQGHPRLATFRGNSLALRHEYIYAPSRHATWLPLDDVLGGADTRFHETPENIHGERNVPLGFDYDPDVLYFASNAGRDTFGVYALNLQTKQRTRVAIETDACDLVATGPQGGGAATRHALVFDGWRKQLVGLRYTGVEPATLWFDRELARVQEKLPAAEIGPTVEILEWDEHRTRFLLRAFGPGRPGVYYVYDAEQHRLDEFLDIAPWLASEALNPGASFTFRSDDDVNVSGYFTAPAGPGSSVRRSSSCSHTSRAAGRIRDSTARNRPSPAWGSPCCA